MNLEPIFRACGDLVGLLSQASVEEAGAQRYGELASRAERLTLPFYT